MWLFCSFLKWLASDDIIMCKLDWQWQPIGKWKKERDSRSWEVHYKLVQNIHKSWSMKSVNKLTHTWTKPPTHSRLIRQKKKYTERRQTEKEREREATTSSSPTCWVLVVIVAVAVFVIHSSFIMNIKNYNLDWNKAQRAHSRIGNLMKSRALI